MARIRTIKPDAFTSDSLARVERGVRWTFAGLWTYCDDDGRGRDDARLIKAALYPLDDHIDVETVEAELHLLAEIGCICRYTEAGKQYLHIVNWGHQRVNRPTPSRIPECSRRTHGGLTEDSPGEGKGKEQGKESCASADAERESDDDFDTWWDAYPRKRGKGQAARAYRIARKKADADTLLAAIRQQAPALMARGVEFVPYPATWLNGERWADQPDSLATVTQLPDGRVVLPPRPKGFFDQ